MAQQVPTARRTTATHYCPACGQPAPGAKCAACGQRQYQIMEREGGPPGFFGPPGIYDAEEAKAQAARYNSLRPATPGL